ncbi:MAG: ABC transporter permease [Actinobacteria bacterium]|nr:ABC transporter permease [Actinomycetota bacterium]
MTAGPSPIRRVIAVLAAALVAVVFISMQSSPLGGSVWEQIWLSTFGTGLGTTSVLQLAMPILFAGLAAAVCQRTGMWNIGIPGQMIMGAWTATWVAYHLSGVPQAPLVLAMMAAGVIGGGLWMLLPALARVYLGVSEIIGTLLLNFVAIQWLIYWTGGPWANTNQNGGGTLIAKPLPAQATLPQFTIGSTTIGLALLIGVALAVVLAAVYRYTQFGYRSALAESGDELVRYAGISVWRTRLVTLVLSGGIAGLGGVLLVLDQLHVLSTSLTADNSGYVGIVAAALAGNALLGVVPSALLFGFLAAIGSALQIMDVSGEIVTLLTGLVLIIACINVGKPRFLARRSSARGTSPPSAPAPEPAPTLDEVAK